MEKTLNFGSAANIQNAALPRDALLSALDECEKVIIDTSELQDADLSFLQTVYSAHIYSLKSGKSLTFTDQTNDNLVALLARAGLAELLPNANLNSWLHGGPSQ